MNLKPFSPLARTLHTLLSDGSMPASAISVASRRALTTLFDTRALVEERRGTGRIVVVVRRPTVQAFAKHRFPAGLYADTDRSEYGARTRALVELRDTKARGGLDFEIVSLRVFNDSALTIEGAPVAATCQTQLLGCIAATLGFGAAPRLAGRVALVEGPEAFLRFDWASIGIDVAILYAGRASDRLLSWVAGCADNVTQVLHCADYDPVGLDEYLRAKKRIGALIVPHTPDNLEELFKRYCKPCLLQDNAALMPRLLASTDPHVRRVAQLMQQHGAGLEQEGLLFQSKQ